MAQAVASAIEPTTLPGTSCAALLDHLTVSVVVIDANTRLLYANRPGSMFLGDAVVTEIDGDVLRLVHPDDVDEARAALGRASSHLGVAPPLILRLRRNRGEYRWVEVSADNQCGSVGIDGIVLTLRDVTSQVAAEDLFRSAFESAPYGLAVVAPDGTYQHVNRSLCELMGYPAEVLMAKTFQDLTHPDDLDADLAFVDQLLAGEIDTYTMEKRYLDPLGEIVWAELKVTLVRDANGDPVHFVSQVVDIGDRKRAEERLRVESLSDPLTGLPNRRALDHALDTTLARGAGTTTVLFCDLDNMKEVNDTIGHNAGDRLLQVTARRIRAALRPNDTVARFGGDEFVVVVTSGPESSPTAGLARRVRVAVERPVAIGPHTMIPRISVGVATSIPNERSAKSLLARADAAMYAAKRQGQPGRT